MESYIQIAGITLLVTLISYIIEHVSPVVNLDNYDILNIIPRFLHYYYYIFLCIFLLLFKGNRTDVYIYLAAVTFMIVSWYICECCVLSYYELKTYNVDISKYDTTFHPTMKLLCRNHSDLAMQIIGVCMTFTVGYILYYNKCHIIHMQII